ncbi:MAG: hypothetical protein JXJ20_13110 [Anaerolineae bacterium]|nr:hypothetical protein [Anaerolineae bacterium]
MHRNRPRNRFITLGGETVAVLSVYPQQIRPIERREIAHTRRIEAA